ncbi:arylesterase [Billgrantia kenyensis]|uniref:Arylesterase n=1 Tax=Billgrantia kenyensis TaxID=321266 RepID=A0A7W0ADN1_9GAMM|nr:arylesterase [Halomonas kenyensis]MBA2778421.1 arylesterase [Halomonas kenyensis]MCG6660727.1 arylesterase [Halomonas kenyensis]
MVKVFPFGLVGAWLARWRSCGAGLAGSALFALALVTTPALAAERPVLLVVGDSLSTAYGFEQEAGWVTLLDERLDGSVRVINASISGETSGGGASRLPELLGQHDPDIVLLELGGNDGLRGLPPTQLKANLAEMIEASQAIGAEVLLLGIDIPPNYGQAYRRAFTDVFSRLAETYDTPLVPFLLEGVALEEGLMQSDGIHPTAEAQPIILDNVWPALEPLLESNGVQLAEVAAE